MVTAALIEFKAVVRFVVGNDSRILLESNRGRPSLQIEVGGMRPGMVSATTIGRGLFRLVIRLLIAPLKLASGLPGFCDSMCFKIDVQWLSLGARN